MGKLALMSSSTTPRVPVFSLGERIRKAREDLGLSQQGFANLLGFDRKTISNWEGERHAPSYGDLMLIASTANVSLQWLAGDRFRGFATDSESRLDTHEDLAVAA